MTEDVTDVIVRLGVEADAVAEDPLSVEFADRLARVLDQQPAVGHVDVRRPAVGKDQQQLLLRPARREVMRRVPQSGTDARRIASLHRRQAALDGVAPGLAAALEMQVADVVPGIRMEAGDGEGVAELIDRPGEQRHGLLTQFEHRLLAIAAADLVGQRLGEVEEQQDGEVAAVAAVAHVDPRIGRDAAAAVDQRTDGDVDVEFAAILLKAQANPFLRLEDFEQALEPSGEGGVPVEQPVDQRRVTRRVQRFVEAHPVGAVALAVMVPLRVMARRQAVDFGAGARRTVFGEHLLVVGEFVEAPEMAVVVAVVDQRIGEVHVGQLVALPAGASHAGERQVGHRLAARLAIGEHTPEAGDEFAQISVGVAVFAIEQGTRQHGQAMAQAGEALRVAGTGDRARMQRAEDAPHARVAADDQRVDAAVLEGLDRQALHRAEVVGDEWSAPAPVAGDVCQCGAIAVDAADAAGVVEDVGQADAARVVVGLRGRHRRRRVGGFAGRGVGDEQRLLTPEAAQIEIEQALVVDQQGAVPLALENGAAVGRLQAEVVALAFGVGSVVAHPVVDPVRQAGNAQTGEQRRCMDEEVRQAGAGERLVDAVDRSRGLLHHAQREVEVALQLPAGGKPPRHRREALQERGDGLAVRRPVQALQRLDHHRQRPFADAAGDCRPFLEEGQQRFGATADATEEAGAVEVGVDARRREDGDGFAEAVGEDAVDLRQAAVEPRTTGGQVLRRECLAAGHAGHRAISHRRRWRRSRARAYRGCRGRR
ncbi:MAG: hypothetical protein FAZ92_02788 [Accumulibacter sp.]|nr:MAG: hypothetical protein FAZ92_02788 [Accumulibacter sp.]